MLHPAVVTHFLCLLWILLAIKDIEFGTEKIRPHLSKITISILLKLVLINSDHVITRLVHSSLLACQHVSVAIRQVEAVFGPKAVEARLTTLNGALDLTN